MEFLQKYVAVGHLTVICVKSIDKKLIMHCRCRTLAVVSRK